MSPRDSAASLRSNRTVAFNVPEVRHFLISNLKYHILIKHLN